MTLLGAGMLENGVEYDHDRCLDAVEQTQQMGTGRPTEDAIFMLDADEVGTALVDTPRRSEILRNFILGDRADDGRRIVMIAPRVVHRVDIDLQPRIPLGERGF